MKLLLFIVALALTGCATAPTDLDPATSTPITISLGAGEEGATPGTGTPGDDDPRIDESEIVEPSRDSTNPDWVPFHEWHSGEKDTAAKPCSQPCGADSLNCERRRECEDSKTNQTRGA